jgi:hypothetical protein
MRNRKRRRRTAADKDSGETFLRKNVVAIAAVTVSVLLGVWNSCETHRYKAEENGRWYALNQPHFDIVDTKLVGFNEVSESRAVSDAWAKSYHPIFSQVMTQDGVPTDRYVVLSDLVFWDSKSNQAVEGTKPMQTDDDVWSEARRFNFANPELRAHYRVSFRLRNLGQLDASKAVARVTITADADAPPEVKTTTPRNIAGHNESFFVLDLYRPLDRPLPARVIFQASLEYDFEGRRQENQVKTIIYYPAGNRWEWA